MTQSDNISTQLGYLRNEAKKSVKGMLSRSASFMELGTSEQLETYRDLVDAEYNRLLDKNGYSPYAVQQAEGDDQPFDAVRDRAGKMIGIKDVGSTFGSMVQQVNFPQFVRDLVQAVYEANINLTTTQMEMFTEMLKSVTGSLQGFISEIADSDSFSFLVEKEPDKYSMITEKDEKGNPKPILIDKDTMMRMEESDDEFRAKIMDAKIKMAQERRMLLRETILMGVSRIVVTSGKIRAHCKFNVNVSDRLTGSNEDSETTKTTVEVNAEASGRYGLFGPKFKFSSKFGRESNITVSTKSDIDSSQSATAELFGQVELNFKSDYFKLDNFKDLFPNLPTQDQAGAPANQAPAPAR